MGNTDMSNAYFQFKQFTIWHDKCAMKVGTDGVLVGVLTPTGTHRRILDVGTGSGLIALMLAQRFPKAEITAIEIDEDAAQQALENFNNSQWRERIHLVKADFKAFETTEPFDLIVSNPPYFTDALKAPDKQRNMARHNDTLNYHQLFQQAHRLLCNEGECCLIIPAEAAIFVKLMAERNHFFPKHITHIYTKPGKPCRRVFITFWRGAEPDLYYPGDCQQDELYLMDTQSQYSPAYRSLTEDFYLKL